MNKRDPFCKCEMRIFKILCMQMLCHDRNKVPTKRAHAGQDPSFEPKPKTKAQTHIQAQIYSPGRGMHIIT